ncbi:MAG TPA: Rdx family protein [Acidimicrobiales bacterium]|nr:Rdx family protein [Acidimicrobiales bacterium]
MPQAVGLTDELLNNWAPIIKTVELLPSSKGRFEVSLDGELIFSKAQQGRHAKPGEVVGLVTGRIGPPVFQTD